MPDYMIQSAYTSDAWGTMIKNPQDRGKALRPVVERLGGKVVAAYLAFGEYDTVGILAGQNGNPGTDKAIASELCLVAADDRADEDEEEEEEEEDEGFEKERREDFEEDEDGEEEDDEEEEWQVRGRTASR